MPSSNAGPITGSELIYAIQDGKRVLLTRPQLASLIGFTAAVSPLPRSWLTEKTGDENFRMTQGGNRVEFNATDLTAYLAATGAPDAVPAGLQPALFSGRERIMLRQGAAVTSIDLVQLLYVRGLGGSLGGLGGGGVTPVTPNILPTAAINDFALTSAASSPGNIDLGTLAIPAGDWVMHVALFMPTAGLTIDRPILSLGTASDTIMNSAGNLHIMYPRTSSTGVGTADAATNSLVVSGRDDSNVWLPTSTGSTRRANSYFGGTNTPYLQGPSNEPRNVKTSLFVQKINNVVQVWVVTPGRTALLHDYIGSTFGAVAAKQLFLNKLNRVTTATYPNSDSTTYQRFFFAGGKTLTALQMEAIHAGVDPRQYIAFNAANGDRLVAFQGATGTAVPDLVGSGTYTINGTWTAAAGGIIPTTVIADQPRVQLEGRGQVIQRTGASSDLTLNGTMTGTDDDVYVQVTDTSDTTIYKAWTKIAASSGGAWSGKITGVPTPLALLHVQLRKGLNGTPFIPDSYVMLGELIDLVGQSISEQMRVPGAGGTRTAAGANAAFISSYSRARSLGGSVQSLTRRGWIKSATGGPGEIYMADALATALGCPIGVCASAVSGSPTSVWAPGSSVWADFVDTWQRQKPGYLVWQQGQGDLGTLYATYQTFLDNFYANTKAAFDASSPNWKMIVAPLNPSGDNTAGAVAWQNIRTAQRDWADAKTLVDPRVIMGGNFTYMTLVDTIHETIDGKGSGILGEMLAQDVIYLVSGGFSAAGPKAVSSVWDNTAKTLTVTWAQNGGTGLTTRKAGDITGFTYSVNGFSSAITADSAVIGTGNTTVHTFTTAAPSTKPTLRYQYGFPGGAVTPLSGDGYTPSVDNPLLDNRARLVTTAQGYPAMFTSVDLA